MRKIRKKYINNNTIVTLRTCSINLRSNTNCPTFRFNPPRKQPDNREQEQQGGEQEACMAVLNNFYGDGIKWHDVACHHEKPIVCEDTEGHLNFARQQFPSIRIP